MHVKALDRGSVSRHALCRVTVSGHILGLGTLLRNDMTLGRGTVFRLALSRVTVSRHGLSQGTFPRHVMALGQVTLARHRTRSRHLF